MWGRRRLLFSSSTERNGIFCNHVSVAVHYKRVLLFFSCPLAITKRLPVISFHCVIATGLPLQKPRQFAEENHRNVAPPHQQSSPILPALRRQSPWTLFSQFAKKFTAFEGKKYFITVITTACHLPLFSAHQFSQLTRNVGPRWRSWLRHCSTNRKVAGSILDGVSGFFSLA
jgi:hypothetical protein